MGTVIYLLGLAACIWCLYDLFTTKKETTLPIKILVAVVILAFSWIGLAVYYFVLRKSLK